MEVTVVTTGLAEEVTVAEIKTITGYPGTDQDTRIEKLITVAREWLEARTGTSALAKSYKAHFEKSDRDSGGWYELPFSPVIATPAITVTVCGVSSTFEQKGLSRVYVRPAATWATIPAGGSETYYVEVVFTAGKSSETANECIRRIVVSMFNEPQDGAEVSVSRLPYDTMRLIESIDQNTGF
jgi:hypothetical protein